MLSRTFRFLTIVSIFIVSMIGPTTSYAQENTPEGVVSAFLDAWNAQDIDLMYSYLSPQSKEFYAPQVFQARYQVAEDAMSFTGVSYEIIDTHLQGITAAVNYNVVIDSSQFGELIDEGRTMRLVNNNGTWGIAWSSMDIIDDLTADSTMSAIGDLPPRASIYDRNGNVVAGSSIAVALYVNKQSMGNEADCQRLMSQITRRPLIAFERLFTQFNPDTNFFLEELNDTTYTRYRERLEAVCGIAFTTNRQARNYYGENAMSHVVGFVGPITAEQSDFYRNQGYNPGALVGQMGVELEYQDLLAGKPDRLLQIREPGGTIMRSLASSLGTDSTPLQLTIDRDLQLATAQALADAYDYAYPNWGSPSISGGGAAVVLDVNSGQILSMASFPLLDPILFDSSADNPNPYRAELLGQVVNDPREPLANHALQNQFTPGSVFKVITSAAVLNEDLIQPDETFFCDLYWDGRPFGDTREQRQDWRVADGFEAAGEITPAEAIMSSCNPFFWQHGAILFNDVGRAALTEYAADLGVGRPFNIFSRGAPEAPGRVDIPTSTDKAINESVGQGDVSLPPIQMAVVTAAIANGGTVYKPYVLQQVGGFNGSEVQQVIEPTILNEVDFDPEVLATVQEGMCGVVSNENLGTAYYVFDGAPYTVCGKTGTAQTALYPNAWFIAYAPAENPQIAVAVMVSQSREGSEVAAPITRRILDYYFQVDNVEPYPEWWAQGPYVPLDNPAGG